MKSPSKALRTKKGHLISELAFLVEFLVGTE